MTVFNYSISKWPAEEGCTEQAQFEHFTFRSQVISTPAVLLHRVPCHHQDEPSLDAKSDIRIPNPFLGATMTSQELETALMPHALSRWHRVLMVPETNVGGLGAVLLSHVAFHWSSCHDGLWQLVPCRQGLYHTPWHTSRTSSPASAPPRYGTSCPAGLCMQSVGYQRP
jgi:hypothetical protein